MKTMLPVAASLATLLLAGAAHAACSDEIKTFEQHLDAVGRMAGAADVIGSGDKCPARRKGRKSRGTRRPLRRISRPRQRRAMLPRPNRRRGPAAGGDRVMQAKGHPQRCEKTRCGKATRRLVSRPSARGEISARRLSDRTEDVLRAANHFARLDDARRDLGHRRGRWSDPARAFRSGKGDLADRARLGSDAAGYDPDLRRLVPAP